MDKKSAVELSNVLKAYSEGKVIEFNNKGTWESISKTYFDWFMENFNKHIFRIKPEPKLVPFTFEDSDFLLGKTIKPKGNYRTKEIIWKVNDSHINENHIFRTFEYLLEDYVFNDNSPCGKYVND